VSELTNAKSRPLVQWVHRGNPYLIDDLDTEGPIGAIAASVLQAARLDTSIAAATERGFGAIIDVEAHRVQLPYDHPLRLTYREAGLDWLREVYDPAAMTLSEQGRSELLALQRDAQAEAGATIFLSPGYRLLDTPILGAARQADLDLQADFLALARSSGASHAAPGSGHSRGVATQLAVDARELSPRLIGELARSYGSLDPDIFCLSIWNFSPSERQYGAVRHLARQLQRESGLGCMIAGLGALWEGSLRNQIAAAWQGWGHGNLSYPPPPPPPRDDEGKGTPYGVPAFHPAIRGCVPLGEAYERPSRQLYRRHPCPCGHHTPTIAPEGQRERHLHNRYWAEQLGAVAIEGDPAFTTAALGPIVKAANQLRDELGLRRLPSAWRKAAVDPSDGERIQVPGSLWLPRAVAV